MTMEEKTVLADDLAEEVGGGENISNCTMRTKFIREPGLEDCHRTSEKILRDCHKDGEMILRDCHRYSERILR